jgi:hypothetical protein
MVKEKRLVPQSYGSRKPRYKRVRTCTFPVLRTGKHSRDLQRYAEDIRSSPDRKQG